MIKKTDFNVVLFISTLINCDEETEYVGTMNISKIISILMDIHKPNDNVTECLLSIDKHFYPHLSMTYYRGKELNDSIEVTKTMILEAFSVFNSCDTKGSELVNIYRVGIEDNKKSILLATNSFLTSIYYKKSGNQDYINTMDKLTKSVLNHQITPYEEMRKGVIEFMQNNIIYVEYSFYHNIINSKHNEDMLVTDNELLNSLIYYLSSQVNRAWGSVTDVSEKDTFDNECLNQVLKNLRPTKVKLTTDCTLLMDELKNLRKNPLFKQIKV